MGFVISEKVRKKLQNKLPPVTREEIRQCFANRNGVFLLDQREDNQTNPPTQWFIAETDYGRKLKVVFILKSEDIIIKTAYDANSEEKRIFQKYGET